MSKPKKGQNNEKNREIDIIKEMQAICKQMIEDDISENPDIAGEFFDCSCCAKYKCLAGSIQYGDYRLCNDCVLYAEIGFSLKKLKNISDLIEAMEEQRLDEICGFINEDMRIAQDKIMQSAELE